MRRPRLRSTSQSIRPRHNCSCRRRRRRRSPQSAISCSTRSRSRTLDECGGVQHHDDRPTAGRHALSRGKRAYRRRSGADPSIAGGRPNADLLERCARSEPTARNSLRCGDHRGRHGKRLVNAAQAQGPDGVASNAAQASIELREELFRDRAFVMGRVVEGAATVDGIICKASRACACISKTAATR